MASVSNIAVAIAFAASAAAITFAKSFQTGPELMQHCNLSFESGLVLHQIPNAKTDKQIELGLSKRDDVSPGMLFSWDDAQRRAFWMKNTRKPLSIGFFDATGLFFQIENMKAFSLEPHNSNEAAKYALELPLGDFEQIGLAVGDRLSALKCS